MSGPCLADTDAIVLSRDAGGNIVATLKTVPNGGLAVVAGGAEVDIIASGGLALLSGGIATRFAHYHSGWTPGDNDIINPGVSVAAGGYVQVGTAWSLGVQRRGPANQWIHLTYGAEVQVALSDPTGSNTLWGWSAQLERTVNGGAEVEIAKQGVSGPNNAVRHGLHADEWLLLTNDLVWTISTRLTLRGGSAGIATAQQTAKRFAHGVLQ